MMMKTKREMKKKMNFKEDKKEGITKLHKEDEITYMCVTHKQKSGWLQRADDNYASYCEKSDITLPTNVYAKKYEHTDECNRRLNY